MSDDHALTKFEAAVLLELCEQQAPEVLRAMRSSSDSVAHKQQFLLRFVRGPTDLNGANSAASALAARPLETSSSAPAAALASPSHASNAQVAVVAAKVVAIARSVFSPQVQTEILDAAVAYRAKHDSSAPSDASLSQKMELLGLIERLLRKHALPEEQVAYLVRLVLNENRLLLSALQSHRLDQSASDLEKAVQQIAALGPGPATSSTTKSPKKRTSSLTKRASSPRKSARAPQPVLQGVVARPIDILHALHQKQLLTTLEYDLLAALVKQQDTQVLAAIDAFERSRDVATLRDALVFIVEDITTELGDDERAAIASRRSDRNGAASGGTAHWQAHIVALVHHWRDRDLLDAEYVPVLEALVATRHNLLQSAYEVFVSDGDASELLDTLQRIAKLQRQADDGAALEQFSRVVDAHCDVLRESEKALVKQLFVRRNALVQAAWDVYGVEQNVHDLGDTLLRIARFTSRADAKLRLVEVVGEMLRRRLVRSHEADGLIRLFEEKNDALLAAAEAFESDGDVNELVETLLLVVKHANFGDPPVCSPRHAHRSRFRTVSTAPSLEFGESGTDERAALQLIERLRATGRLADWQREVLMTLVGQHDDRVLAAMDVYNDDADVRELVDTLSCLCDLLVWDEHAPSIVREWVTPLEQRGAVPRGVLQELIANRDDRVLAAFVVYLGDRNDDEFVDSLERIARIATRQSAESMTERVDCAIDLARADAQLAALVTDGLLSSSDCATVKTLVRASHAQVLAAFDVLDATDDRSDFVDTLARILARHANSGAEDGRSEALASSTASPIARMEKQLLHFASELRLAPAALAALKRSIARQDEILTAAVEVYEVEQDEVRPGLVGVV